MSDNASRLISISDVTDQTHAMPQVPPSTIRKEQKEIYIDAAFTKLGSSVKGLQLNVSKITPNQTSNTSSQFSEMQLGQNQQSQQPPHLTD